MVPDRDPTIERGELPRRSPLADVIDDELGARPPLVEALAEILARVDAARERPAAALAAFLAVVLTAFGAWWLGRPPALAPVEAGIPLVTTSSLAPPTSTTHLDGDGDPEPTELLVHVAGAVARPGVVTLDPDARIGDAVDAAGGPTPAADLHQLNLAAPVSDGLQIRVPVEGEVVSPVGVPAGGRSPAPGVGEGVDAGPVPINAASEAELQRLPGIGPALAAAIVEWRTTNGPFASVDDLLAVPGIGPAKLAGFADQVAL